MTISSRTKFADEFIVNELCSELEQAQYELSVYKAALEEEKAAHAETKLEYASLMKKDLITYQYRGNTIFASFNYQDLDYDGFAQLLKRTIQYQMKRIDKSLDNN